MRKKVWTIYGPAEVEELGSGISRYHFSDGNVIDICMTVNLPHSPLDFGPAGRRPRVQQQ